MNCDLEIKEFNNASLNFKKKIITKFLDFIYKDYFIINKKTNKAIDIHDMQKLISESEYKKCNAIIKGKKCKKTVESDTLYCEKHYHLTFKESRVETMSTGASKPNKLDVDEITVNNNIYYKDKCFIYDKCLNKIGLYNNGDILFTNDPFELEF